LDFLIRLKETMQKLFFYFLIVFSLLFFLYQTVIFTKKGRYMNIWTCFEHNSTYLYIFLYKKLFTGQCMIDVFEINIYLMN